MRRIGWHAVAMVFGAALTVGAASAQQPQGTRIRGTIEKLDGDVLSVKSGDGASLQVTLAPNVQVVDVEKATLADIKPGEFVGSAAMPQPDGTQTALEVHIFAESMRGSGEGHRPYAPVPKSTMTNGTVDQSVKAVEGHTMTVRYRDGEKKIVIPPDVPIVRYVVGDKNDLKAGAHVTILSATKQADGHLETARVNVGRNGVVPQ